MINKSIERRKRQMTCLIVCGGTIDSKLACTIVKRAGIEIIIAVDKGMDFLYKSGITPDIIVGDFDSTQTDALEYYTQKGQSDIIRLNAQKDDTDTEFAIMTAIEKGAHDIMLIGATGTRVDHVLGNISLLGIGMKMGVDIRIIDANNQIRMINSRVSIKKSQQYGHYVSLIPITEDNEITLVGFKYPLSHFTFEKFTSLGISNEIMDDIAYIEVHKGVFILVESMD